MFQKTQNNYDSTKLLYSIFKTTWIYFLPAIAWLWGPPCSPGNTAWLMRLSRLYRVSFPVFASTLRTPVNQWHVCEKCSFGRLNILSNRIEFTFSEENDACPAAPQGLVGSGGNNITVFKGRGNHSCCNQTTNVGHVCQKIGSIFICYLSHATVVQVTRIAAGALKSFHKKG